MWERENWIRKEDGDKRKDNKTQDRELFDGIFTYIEYLSLISLVSSVCKWNGRAAGPL